MEGRKQAVSIRLGAADLRNVKKLARRLGVRDSDVIRFAVKNTLAKLAPLIDPEAKGRNLVPVFLESGSEMVRYLDLDATRLEAIINDEADAANRVDYGDIQLLAYSGMQRSYAKLRLTMINGRPASTAAAAPDDETPEDNTLRRYFYQKYLFEQRAAIRTTEAETQS